MTGNGRRPRDRDADRGVGTLLSLVTALTVLTIVLTGTMVIVEDAYRETARGDAERAVAIQASDRLVAADGPIADRANVLNRTRVDAITAADLRSLGANDRFAMAVSLDGERLAAAGDPGDGHVVRRIVLVERSERVERTPDLDGPDQATLPVRTDELDLAIATPPNTTVTSVRVNDRVALANPAGLNGTHAIPTAPYETVRLSFDATGPLTTGDVTVAYDATSSERAPLAVTVSDRQRATARGRSP